MIALAEETFEFKVVVAGPFASGKTTLISAISDSPVVGTEAPTSGGEAAVKATTTVGMEYGTYEVVEAGLHVVLHLYGVPGQSRFEFMWDIVGEGMDGLVVLVDATDPTTWGEAAEVERHFRAAFDPVSVVAANRAVDRPELVAAVRGAIPSAAHVGCDVTDPRSARDLLVELLLQLLDELPDEELVG
jgi:signal recognition particle receptor subunit beta